MNKITAIIFSLIVVPAFACEALVSPPWFILDKNKNPVAVRVFETDGQEGLELTFQTNSGKGLVRLKKPAKGYKWVYGTCAPNKKLDQTIFALVKEQYDDGWAKEISVAYRVNLESRGINNVSLSNLYCYSSTM